MNNRFAIIGFVTCFVCTAFSADPQIGESKDEVIEQLGKPQGKMLMRNKEVLFYERGTVELTDGHVSTSKLLSAQGLYQEKLKKAQDQKAAEARQEQLREEGEKEKKRILSDASFTNKPPQEQLSYWEDFKKKYPGVVVENEAQQAATQVQKQRATAQVINTPTEPKEPPKKYSSSKRRKAQRSIKYDPSENE